MSVDSPGSAFRDEFPDPTHTRFDRGASDEIRLSPYRDPESNRSPQAEFLAGPEGMADIESDARNHAFVSGLGAGKTAAGCLRAWVNAEAWNPNSLGMIVAPTTPAIKNAILPELRSLGLLSVCEYNGKGADEPGIITPSGTRIILESADNDRKIERLRGSNLAWVWVDEAATISSKAWDILSGRLRVGNYRNAFITTTPRGRNWCFDRFYDDPDRQTFISSPYQWVQANDTNGVFGVPSWLNPYNPDDYIERLRDEYTGEFFEQEVEGAFTSFEGLVYPWFDRGNIVDSRPSTYDEVIYAVDWGHNNPSVILAIVRQGDYWIVVDEWYERRCTVNDHAVAAEDMVERYGPGPIYCDPSEPANIQVFRRHDLDARAADNDVLPGIKKVEEKRDLLRVVSTCQAVRNEFSQYQYRGDDTERPLKSNDHAMDSLRYGLFTHDDTSDVPVERPQGARPMASNSAPSESRHQGQAGDSGSRRRPSRPRGSDDGVDRSSADIHRPPSGR